MVTVVEDWSGSPPTPELLELVDQIAVDAPYHYTPPEFQPACEWFTALVAKRGAKTCVAADAHGSPVGFCVVLPLVEHPGAAEALTDALLDHGRTLYLAELGVAVGHRRRGVAGSLLAEATSDAAGRAVVVRTIVDNAPAIAFYRRHGFRVLDDIRLMAHGRERLFLLRPPS